MTTTNFFIVIAEFEYWKVIDDGNQGSPRTNEDTMYYKKYKYTWDTVKHVETIEFKSSTDNIIKNYEQFENEVTDLIYKNFNNKTFTFIKNHNIRRVHNLKDDTSRQGEGYRFTIKE